MSAQAGGTRTVRIANWLGPAALAGGGLVLYLFVDRLRAGVRFDVPSSLVYLLTAAVLVVWGVRTSLAGFGPWRGSRMPCVTRHYRVYMPREAQAYVVILIVLFLGALLGRSNLLLLVFSLMAGPFILNGQLTFLMIKRVDATRILPEYATAGRAFPVGVRLTNRKLWFTSWMLVVSDVLRNRSEQLFPGVLVARLPPRSHRVGTYEVLPTQRGVYEFGPIRVASRFPLGLFERSFELDDSDELIVYPRIGRLTARWHAAGRLDKPSKMVSPAAVGARDEEYHRLRQYRSGDNPRAIHWRTTARRNELMVREFQHTVDGDLVVVLDLAAPPQLTEADEQRVELAVAFAASLCADSRGAAAGSDLFLITVGRSDSVIRASRDGASTAKLLAHLAVVEPGPAAGLEDILVLGAEVGLARARRVLITTRHTSAGAADAQASTAASGGTGLPAAAGWEVVEANPQCLAAWVSFDE